MKVLKRILPLVAMGLALSSVSAQKASPWKNLDATVSKGNHAASLAALEKAQAAKKPLYDGKNQISLELDKGILAHYAGDYAASAESLEKAETLIEEAFTKSVTADFASYIANDNTKEYAGEDYENIYLSVFNALNKYNQGDIDGAGVEIRRITRKLVAMEDKYGDKVPAKTGASAGRTEMGAVALQVGLNAGLLVASKAAGIPGIQITIPPELLVTKGPIRYTDSTLARYLSAIIYRAKGDLSNARQDIEGIKAAAVRETTAAEAAKNSNDPLNTQPRAAIYFAPEKIDEELNVPAGQGRLNIIAFTGRGPVKEEKIYDMDLDIFPAIQALASFATPKNRLTTGNLVLPNFRSNPSGVSGVEVSVNGSTTKLELLEDIGAGVQAAFAAKFKTAYSKTWIRSTIKYVSVEASAQVAVQQGLPPIAVVAAVGGAKKSVDASEKADVRGSRYFPSKAYVGGINLDPGEYDITVTFSGGDKITKHVKVEAGKLNLLEAVSLK